MSSLEWTEQFEQRKRDHIRIALEPRSQAGLGPGLNQIELIHEALPDLNFNELSIESRLWDEPVPTPFLISSMTAGHAEGYKINLALARAAQARGWAMGVGSQRRELHDPHARREWQEIRAAAPQVLLFGNIGIAQLICTPTEQIAAMVERLQARAMIVHCNPLQECLQPEGNPQFRGAIGAIARLVEELSVPVIVKETGCGFSAKTLVRLNDVGVRAVDLSGLGGTHWGRVEGQRSQPGSVLAQTAETFADWGLTTVESLLAAIALQPRFEIWASGGVRSGLDAAKLLALGAQKIGLAQPLMAAAVEGEPSLLKVMEQIEFELKVALFCTGCQNLKELQGGQIWRRRP